MTTEEMIEVMQAFERGEKIELSDVDADNWVYTRLPSWNFEDYKYRIKPKEEKKKSKFKVGDKIVHKELCDGTPLNKDNSFLAIEDINLSENKYEVYNKRVDTFEFFDIKMIDENYVNIDDCLWYWEYRDVISDSCYMYSTRLNKAAYKNLCTNRDWDLDFEPIYQLGARLPKDKK
ncbi:hypothetical protein CFTD6783_08340 [Campylobacter fetus subsp. testudinum]|uniref:hypothetical protein n=1 Tax=Campylobacter fetus TaxID=196 RepID=UPI00081886BA|nr:hypothetical protein [Campylobacter fetus]OCS09366.1 hypothetical protein CFTD6783_08340 [Campylobacter fetus subsp. testudinum]